MNTHTKHNDWDTPERLPLVKETAAKNCTDQEFQMLLYIARTYGLNPLLREVFAQKYKNKSTGNFGPASFIVTRDGFISIAHQTGEFEAMQSRVEQIPSKINKNGVSRDWQYKGVCTVWRKGSAHPFEFEAYEDEYNSNQSVWVDKPRTMIMKVAESQALRKAFRLNGLYTEDEMPQEPTEAVAQKASTPEAKPDLATAQAEFEKANNIAPEKPKPAVTAEYAKDTERMKNLPADIKDFFRWKKATKRDEILKILTANNDDFEAIRGYMVDQGWRGSADLSDVAAEDRVPA